MKILRQHLKEYVAIRRAFGTRFREPAVTLGHFIEYLEDRGAKFITTKLALAWATEPAQVQRATWARRLCMARRFAVWLSANDPRSEIPPRGLIEARHRRNPPHIYTEKEILKLMAEAARLPSPKGFGGLSLTTLIGLLASTGLRPGEALALERKDVDLNAQVLVIRQTKFGKSRLVPIHESTRDALARYAKQRDQLCPRCLTSRFLVTDRGTPWHPSTARRSFARISRAAGLRKPKEGRRVGHGPRLQDMRHTFATRRLLEWYRRGLDVSRQMPKLATYLGHASVANTYWYIEAVPELLRLATELRPALAKGGAR